MNMLDNPGQNSKSESHLIHLSYRPDIDGLRAVAVTSVVGFHAFPSLIGGGFVGVDIFFVISGYLISSIILRSLSKETFTFTEFYVRRIRRIFPALILVLISCITFGWFALLPEEYQQLGKHISAGASFVSNFFFWEEAGYFDNMAETKPLLHLWSLGIEEQFYIFWPLLLYMAWKRKFGFLVLSMSIIAVSFSISVAIRHVDPVQAFYSPITRFWELMMGSLLAYFVLHKNLPIWDKAGSKYKSFARFVYSFKISDAIIWSNSTSIIGIALICFAAFVITKNSAFPGWWALLPTSGTVLVIAAGQQSWVNRIMLSNRFVVLLGMISYPLYLWHWPLLSFARIMESKTPSTGIRIIAVAVALLLAWLTYRLVENPIRFGNHKSKVTPKLILIMSALAVLGYFTFIQHGFRSRVSEQMLAQVDALGRAKHWAVWQPCKNTNESNRCRIMNPDKSPDIAILGDSHAMQLTFALEDIYGPLGKNIIAMAKPGCTPFFEKGADSILHASCDGFMEKALNEVLTSSSIKTVILGNYAVGRVHEGNWMSDSGSLSTSAIERNVQAYKIAMNATLSRLLTAGKKVIVVVDVADLNFDPEECAEIRPLYLPGHKIRNPCVVSKAKFLVRNEQYHAMLKEVRKNFPKVKFIDSYEYFCDEANCYAVIDGELLYRDDNHLNVAGLRIFAEKTASQFLTDDPR